MRSKGNYTLYRHVSPSGKIYVGITNQPVIYRWNNGNGYMNVKKGPFKSTILKYGWDNIKHEILCTKLTEDVAKLMEVSLIMHYKKAGISLNVTDGGEGSHGVIPWNKGIKVPYEKSNKLKGTHLSQEHKHKLSIAHKGLPGKGHDWTEEQREKMRQSRLGKKASDEVRKKIRDNSAFSRKVVELDVCGNIIDIFNSATAAAETYKFDGSWVAKCCRRKTMCSGHIFMYEDDMVEIESVKKAHYRTGKGFSIQNVVTKERKDFDSIKACANFFNFSSISILKKCLNGHKLVKGKWKIVAFNGKEVDYEVVLPRVVPKEMMCKNIKTGEVLTFPSISQLSKFLGLKSSTSIYDALNGKRSNNIFNNWETN